MNDSLYLQLLDLAAGLVLVCAFVVLWRRSLTAIIRALAAQGAGIAGVALLLGVHGHDSEALAAAAVVLALKAVIVPIVLSRAALSGEDTREVTPLVNVPASLVAAALLTLTAYATTTAVVAVAPTAESRAIPIGVAVVLIGLFTLATRRKAVTQIVGFLLVDNGIALVAFLATAGVPLLVELGAALDLLLAVLILQVLTVRMRSKFGGLDLDQLQQLRD
jgi:hydrogenase-4 component E